MNGKGSWAFAANFTETEFALSGGKIRNPDASILWETRFPQWLGWDWEPEHENADRFHKLKVDSPETTRTEKVTSAVSLQEQNWIISWREPGCRFLPVAPILCDPGQKVLVWPQTRDECETRSRCPLRPLSLSFTAQQKKTNEFSIISLVPLPT